MNQMLIDRILGDCIDAWGMEAQLAIAQEEAAELIVAISHWRRNRIAADKVAEEVADMSLMVEQLSLMVGPAWVDQWREKKLERLTERLMKDGYASI